MNVFSRVLTVLVPVAVLWGCSTTGSSPEDAAGGAGAGVSSSSGVDTGTAGRGGVSGSAMQGGGAGFDGNPLNDPSSPLSKRVIYFEYDSSDIKPEARQIIEAHAKYLSANPSVRITVEGHGDERGSREYNLSLGERRAKAVQQIMSLMGVSASQLELVSYGEERPAAMGHDDGAWALNRRVELVY